MERQKEVIELYDKAIPVIGTTEATIELLRIASCYDVVGEIPADKLEQLFQSLINNTEQIAHVIQTLYACCKAAGGDTDVR